LDLSASGDIDTDSVSGAVISAFRRKEEGRGDTSVVAAVSANVIFNTYSRSQDSVWVGCVWAPSALEAEDLTLSQTVRAVVDSSKIRTIHLRRWDFNVASGSSVIEFAVRGTDTSVVYANTVSRAV